MRAFASLSCIAFLGNNTPSALTAFFGRLPSCFISCRDFCPIRLCPELRLVGELRLDLDSDPDGVRTLGDCRPDGVVTTGGVTFPVCCPPTTLSLTLSHAGLEVVPVPMASRGTSMPSLIPLILDGTSDTDEGGEAEKENRSASEGSSESEAALNGSSMTSKAAGELDGAVAGRMLKEGWEGTVMSNDPRGRCI